MLVFPNAKINLGLRIIKKRDDGYHDLETIFYPIYIYDILELIPADNQEPITFSFSGNKIDGEIANNLCYKAWQLLKQDFPTISPLQFHLHKSIPTGAGLGGGSADASFTLKLLNDFFNLGLDEKRLIHYALQLGSDCPFFIKNKPCFAKGRGEQLEEIELNISQYKILLINPGIHIHTGTAFRNIRPATPEISVKEIIQLPIEKWKEKLVNDFEKPVFEAYPEIGKIKEQLYETGASYVAMSGSGSTVYGLFRDGLEPKLNFPPHYFVKWSVSKG